MSLNTFENHYLNRNLDRTGQQSIVITPGKAFSFRTYSLKNLMDYGSEISGFFCATKEVLLKENFKSPYYLMPYQNLLNLTTLSIYVIYALHL